MAEVSDSGVTVVTEKPFYKRVKLMTWLVSIIINGLTLLFAGSISPEVLTFIATVFAGALAFTTEHTISDVKGRIADLTIKN